MYQLKLYRKAEVKTCLVLAVKELVERNMIKYFKWY